MLMIIAGLIIFIVIATGIWAYRLDSRGNSGMAALEPAVPDTETIEPAVADMPEPVAITPEAVSFLDTDIDHAFFPLAGGHDLSCESCHTEGRFADTPAVCSACHAPPSDHFPGECSDCHVINNWVPFQFNHVGVTTCATCHEVDVPANHYTGECVNCHQDTETWMTVEFNHSDFTDCFSCHTGDAPANHFPGQCATCHTSTEDWLIVEFNHSGFTDCASCHTGDAPANHFPGQCATCHTTSAWVPAEFPLHTFPLDHGTGVVSSCETCHTSTYTEYTCYNCHEHEPEEIREEHEDEDIFDFANCIACHPTGREDEFDDD